MRTPALGLRRLSSTSGVFPIAWTMSPYLPPHGRLSRRGSSIASESVVVAGRGRVAAGSCLRHRLGSGASGSRSEIAAVATRGWSVRGLPGCEAATVADLQGAQED